MNYDELVREYHGLVYHIAFGILRDSATAEDATQDVFLDFLQNPGPVGGARNVKALVARAAVNRALKSKRGEQRRARREEFVASSRREAMDPVEQAFQGEIRATVAALPEDQRLAVDLHYFRGFTLAEASEALQVPEGTVSSRISSALGRLRKALGAAAFVGLLAMLESELGKVGAADEVPGGLEGRLLRLQGSTGLRRTRRTAGSLVAGGIVCFLMLAGGVAWKVSHRDDTESADNSAGTMVATTEPDAHPAAPENPAPPPSKMAAALPQKDPADAFEIEGFLYRREGGLALCVEQGIFGGKGEPPKGPTGGALLSADDPLLRGLAAADLPAYYEGGFLMDDHAPDAQGQQSRLRLSVAPVGPATKDAWKKVRVLRVLEKEVLSSEWLAAWWAMRTAAWELGGMRWLEPGLAKRAAVVQAAERFCAARDRAIAARKGDTDIRWRFVAENDLHESAAGHLARVGLERLVPGHVGWAEIVATFDQAANPSIFRATLVERGGADVLRLEVSWYRRLSPDEVTQSTYTVESLGAMTPTEFTELKRQVADAGKLNHPGYTPRDEDQPRYAERVALIASAGLVLSELEAADRERLVMNFGARVDAVTPGSPADRAGFQAGDALWRVHLAPKGGEPHTEMINRVLDAGIQLEMADALQMKTLSVDVVRSTGIVTLELER